MLTMKVSQADMTGVRLRRSRHRHLARLSIKSPGQQTAVNFDPRAG